MVVYIYLLLMIYENFGSDCEISEMMGPVIPQEKFLLRGLRAYPRHVVQASRKVTQHLRGDHW